MCGRVGVKGSTAPKKSKRAQTSKTQAKPRPRPITTWKENANHYDEAAASSDEDGEGPEGQQGSRKGRGGRGQHRALADQHAQTAKPQPQNPSPKPRTTTQTKSKGPAASEDEVRTWERKHMDGTCRGEEGTQVSGGRGMEWGKWEA